MSKVFISLFIIGYGSQVGSQFFDIFSGFQPVYSGSKPVLNSDALASRTTSARPIGNKNVLSNNPFLQSIGAPGFLDNNNEAYNSNSNNNYNNERNYRNSSTTTRAPTRKPNRTKVNTNRQHGENTNEDHTRKGNNRQPGQSTGSKNKIFNKTSSNSQSPLAFRPHRFSTEYSDKASSTTKKPYSFNNNNFYFNDEISTRPSTSRQTTTKSQTYFNNNAITQQNAGKPYRKPTHRPYQETTTRRTDSYWVNDDRPAQRPNSFDGTNQNWLTDLPTSSSSMHRPNFVDSNYNSERNRTPSISSRPSSANRPQAPGVHQQLASDQRQPITNRPAPVENTDDQPQIVNGPDVTSITNEDKQKYLKVLEKLCDSYKDMRKESVAAIPLLPSPDPVSVSVEKCSLSNVPLIVGGKVVSIEEFPHMAAVGWAKSRGRGYKWKCGGSVISNRHVLTAAHCTYEERDDSTVPGPPSVVRVGSGDLWEEEGGDGAQVVRISKIMRHPEYTARLVYHDVAVLVLQRRLQWSARVRPACVGDPPPPRTPVLLTGWGRTEREEQSRALRGVSVEVWDMGRCRVALGTSRRMPQGPLADSQFCAGDKAGGKDSCRGDSGGPAQVADGCAWRVVGVTSYGKVCAAPGAPAVYARAPPLFVAAALLATQPAP